METRWEWGKSQVSKTITNSLHIFVSNSHVVMISHTFLCVHLFRYIYCGKSKRGPVCSEASQAGSYLLQEPKEQERLSPTQEEHVLALPLSSLCYEGVCLHEGKGPVSIYGHSVIYHHQPFIRCEVEVQFSVVHYLSLHLTPLRHFMIEAFPFRSPLTTTDML